MPEGLLKLILRSLATLTNVPLLLLGLYGVFAERSTDNPVLQTFFATVAAMAFLNTLVPWRWRAMPAQDFSFVYRLCRSVAWALNIVVFVFVGIAVAGMGDPRILLMIFPAGLGLLGLFVTRQRQKGVAFDAKIEEPSTVAIKRDTPTEVLPSEGITVKASEKENPPAEVLVKEYCPPEQEEDHPLDQILGRSAAQKKVSIITLPLMLLGLYYMKYGAFVPSREWIIFCAVVALGLAYPLARLGEESLRAPHSRFSLRAGDSKWLLPIAAGFLFFTLTYGAGYTLNGFTGHKTLVPLAYSKRDVEKQCVNVTGETGQLSTQYCLRREDIAYLPDRGQLHFMARKSWFGLSVEDYLMPFR